MAKPNDPVATAQVADLLRQAEMVDDALDLYKKAIELAPTNPQYREYLGEYLHSLKRADEAKAAWGEIALGPNKNAKNLTRLAEVLAGFGYVKEAIAPLTEAVALERDNFSLRLTLANYANRLERYDEAERNWTPRPSCRNATRRRTPSLRLASRTTRPPGGSKQRIEGLRKDLEGNNNAPAERWRIFARYLEADAKLPEAVRAIDQAIAIEPRSIPAWTLAARIRESAGSLGDAADALRRLAEIDRRNRIEHLTGIAKLESRLGQIDAALKAGRDLLAAAPGNPESYEFFAQLCFGLGRSDEGLDALRRAVRVNPNDTKIALTPGRDSGRSISNRRGNRDVLAGLRQGRRTSTPSWGSSAKLTELYLQRNQFDRLLTRIQNQEREGVPARASLAA